MLSGKLKIPLTPDTILDKISSYDIFRHFMPDKDWELNKATNSPFRRDISPSFVIGNRHGELSFVDFGLPDCKGDCFTFVKTLFNLSTMDEVLRKIDQDFGLGLVPGVVPLGNYKRMRAEYKQPEDAGKRYSLIQVVTKKFTKQDLDYWLGYFQEEADLKREKIYSVKELFINRRKFSLSSTELCFGYLYEKGTWKIYRPHSDKKGKWMSNVPLSLACELENLDKNYNSLICKSKKDFLVCHLVYPYTCYVQNESMAAFSKETVAYIKEHSKNVFYGGDSDVAGKAASYIITQAFGYKHINPPDRLLPHIKDMADWAREEGLDKLTEHFKIKKLIE